MHIKTIFVLAFACAVSARDLIVGIHNGGMKIYDENQDASPALWTQVHNVTINATDDEVISRIIVTDLRAEKDGEAKIVEGGEGHNNVTIQLKSPTAFRGYYFHVEVYASKDLKTNGVNKDDGFTKSKPEDAQLNPPRTKADDVKTNPITEAGKKAPSSDSIESSKGHNNDIKALSTSATTEMAQANVKAPKDLKTDSQIVENGDEEEKLMAMAFMFSNVADDIKNQAQEVERFSTESDSTKNQDSISHNFSQAAVHPINAKEETTTKKATKEEANHHDQTTNGANLDQIPTDTKEKNQESKNTSTKPPKTKDDQSTVKPVYQPLSYDYTNQKIHDVTTATEKADHQQVVQTDNDYQGITKMEQEIHDGDNDNLHQTPNDTKENNQESKNTSSTKPPKTKDSQSTVKPVYQPLPYDYTNQRIHDVTTTSEKADQQAVQTDNDYQGITKMAEEIHDNMGDNNNFDQTPTDTKQKNQESKNTSSTKPPKTKDAQSTVKPVYQPLPYDYTDQRITDVTTTTEKADNQQVVQTDNDEDEMMLMLRGIHDMNGANHQQLLKA